MSYAVQKSDVRTEEINQFFGSSENLDLEIGSSEFENKRMTFLSFLGGSEANEQMLWDLLK